MNNFTNNNQTRNNPQGGIQSPKTNNGGNEGNGRPEPLRLDIKPMDFDGVMKSKLTTTIALSKTINSVFRKVLTDYEGCIVAPDQFGQLQVALYFKDKGAAMDGAIKSLIPVTARNQGDKAIDRLMRMNLRNSSKSYDISAETKQILSDFIYTRGNSKVNWNNHIVEQTEQQYNGYSIYVKVIGLDLVRLVRKIYGGKKDGSRIDYNVSIIKPVGVDIAGNNQNFLVNVQQLDSKEVEKLAAEVGLVPTMGSIPMIR